ncbi:NAD(P)(+) transhydrogenase (Re/Si-specific) subunit beta [Jatrophihabitans lederbergiae]|uniref:NAD(P) transhydrogenase subunit beta n=1 Tax=Jatrophihabitans lederbergiae TaxID=3075547 RepID=A0ABU2J6X2_9ACTN|nr:NAD(P)(+) transhydrogenase (Re/Si-specific) subunit beta [Jatrophihabitans sp. DSM 44399]MDT0260003.1 NAD(P)(+) transhydrogenase (Re/Si-specific) subunit beta [Jatrophihabitans sp. DSM 44399]
MSGVDTGVRLASLFAAVAFVLGLHLMNSPATARRGNQLSAFGMLVAVLAVLVSVSHGGSMTLTRWLVLGCGALIGGAAGLYSARTVEMTQMPQLVSLFNAVGGGAATLIALADYQRDTSVSAGVATATVLDVVIGGVTFSGSLIAAAKLQGHWSQPVSFPGARFASAALTLAALAAGVDVIAGAHNAWILTIVVVTALGIGILMVLPIGGADMPVVISLLNAFTGTAVAMAGFVLGNATLTIAGALVGASGGILTKLMADAMNRSVLSIIAGGFGTGATGVEVAGGSGGTVKSIAIDDAALQLAYASKVIVVPGYGLAAAQAQHEVRELGELLESRGIEVSYAIHPVAGRMPGHMNVLLAEANVSYDQLREMEDVNPEFDRTDVVLVVGANDVTNPAARRPGNAVSGMPILDVDHARSIIVVKRSMASGYAGIDNELYGDPKTSMLFSDAKKGLASLVAATKLVD